MDVQSMAGSAYAVAYLAHRGQVDKIGRPYIEHPAAVVGLLQRERPNDLQDVIVGWLHDVLEDTEVTAEDLIHIGIDGSLVSDVSLLTRTKGMSSEDYYQRIKSSIRAIRVKHADIRHNSDPRRLILLDRDTRERLIGKYAAGLELLGGFIR